jgi:phage/plasmid primase-like uncharacterized protein
MAVSFENNLYNALASYGLSYSGEIKYHAGSYHRFTSNNGACKNNCCGYRIFESQLGAHIICFRQDIDEIWFDGSYKRLFLHEKIALEEERRRILLNREKRYKEKSARCIKFLSKIIHLPNKAIHHPYIIRKKILPLSAITVRDLLVIPILNIHHEIQSLQFITKSGFKLFKKGAPTTGGMIWLTIILPVDYSGVIRLCEGWATGCTIAQLTKQPVVCALNAYNIVRVALDLKRKYIHAHIKICSDNDSAKKKNVGLKYATDAAKAIGASLHYPIFENNKGTDFNDLFILSGEEATRRQLTLIRK